ncbi:hypothetical protein CTAYLR_007427 [Chrysophaeum taylorii]|uniref:7-dehydrocholesterol reductase n=1 Tax=Chrysophaeum taylorii TaxID=2483200 RepID=A0AAD7U9T6_9STRA|nr:hypothetical protein CTAYLR_007427 [Chrysophaeum taylorii]
MSDRDASSSSSTKRKMESTFADKGGLLPGREVMGPLFLIFGCPVFSILAWHTNYNLGGSFLRLAEEIYEAKGVATYAYSIWPSPFQARPWKFLLCFMAFELLLMKAVPGKPFEATITAMGNVPRYTANGVQCYVISLVALLVLGGTGVFQPGDVYDLFGPMLSCLNLFALVFCAGLMIKGYVAPSSSDSGTNGSYVFDFYWGTELYPRILGWDVKMFTNCRFGMMFWALAPICYAHKQYQDIGYVSSSLFVSLALQLVYITKFFWWETGYLCSMDIQHDRAGYYICWGCLVWLPCIYTSQVYYMVKHPLDLGPVSAAGLFAFGIFSIWANYDADRQRQAFRANDGNLKIWGKPAACVRATYTTSEGKTRSSCLLASGWWGLARHFHYIPEITASLAWSVPFFPHFMPYFYVIYLTILLMDRAWRDDDRCSVKYGKFWDAYCNRVPYKIIPGLI